MAETTFSIGAGQPGNTATRMKAPRTGSVPTASPSKIQGKANLNLGAFMQLTF